MTTLLKFDQFTQIALYCKPEWFIVITAIYIVLRTDTYQHIMQAEYAMAENTVSGWSSQQVTHVSGPHS